MNTVKRMLDVFVWFLFLAFLAFAVSCLCARVAKAEPNVTNTVMMVDQNGNLNVAGVASVADVATNAVKVQVAQAAASTAQGVTNALNGIVENIVSNNVVIYRYGYSDSFAGLIVFSDDDKLLICEYQKVSLVSGTLVSKIGYVCTADIGVSKPVVMVSDTLSGGRENFTQVSDANVTTPQRHDEQKTIGGTTYDKWYEITVTCPVVGTPSSYFYYIKLDADTPSGDGATLELPNGVTGGVTQSVTWGDKLMVFKGGMLLEVRDAN